MNQIPELHFSGCSFLSGDGFPWKGRGLAHPPLALLTSQDTVTTHKYPSVGCDGAAGACRAPGESQRPCSDRPRAACPSQQGLPLEPPGQTATSRSLPVLFQSSKGVSVQECAGGKRLPLPLSHTEDAGGCGPLSSLHLLSTAGDTHTQDAIRGHTQGLMHERAHTHAHGGPQSPTSVTLRQHLEHGKCQSCHRVCLWQGSMCDC